MREALVYAPGVAISPVPIAATLLLLTCPRAVANGVSFVVGWTAGVAALTLVLVTLVNRAGITDSDPEWVAVTELLVGAGFLFATIVLWLRRHRRSELSAPWVDALDRFTTGRSAGLGVVLSGANPKVAALSFGAALSLAQADAGAAVTASTIVLFTAIGAVGALAPLAIYLAAPSHAEAVLTRFRAWLGWHETSVLVVVGLLISTVFIADGLREL